MKRISFLALTSATVALASCQVLAAPVGVSPGSGTSLQEVLNNITVGGQSSVEVNTDQVPLSHATVHAAGGSFNQVIGRFGPGDGDDALGVFDSTNPNNRINLFSGSSDDGYTSTLQINQNGHVTVTVKDGDNSVIETRTADFASGNNFGFFLKPQGSGTLFSVPGINGDGQAHLVAFQGNDTDQLQISDSVPELFTSDEYILAWEDTAFPGSDSDYNDFVSIIKSVSPVGQGQSVPEPATTGLFGLGLLGIASLLGIRRRHSS